MRSVRSTAGLLGLAATALAGVLLPIGAALAGGVTPQASVVVALAGFAPVLLAGYVRDEYTWALGPRLVRLGGFLALSSLVAALVAPALDQGLSAVEAGLITVASGALSALSFVIFHRSVAARLPLRLLGIGCGPAADRLNADFRACQPIGYELIGFVAQSDGDPGDVETLGGLDELEDVVAANRVDCVVLTAPTQRLQALEAALSVREPVMTLELTDIYERALGRVPCEEINAAWFLHVLGERRRRMIQDMVNRVVALAALVLLAPLLGLVALAVRIDSRGPALYRQERVGERGRRFTILKFRSMVIDAESNGAQWAGENDPRVTRVGRFLRLTRLDELPQLLNVVRGEMALVGPRPERPEFVEQLSHEVPFFEFRGFVKPGITGWAQVYAPYGASVEDASVKLSYDLYYLRHRSIATDLAILFRTIWVVISGAGAR